MAGDPQPRPPIATVAEFEGVVKVPGTRFRIWGFKSGERVRAPFPKFFRTPLRRMYDSCTNGSPANVREAFWNLGGSWRARFPAHAGYRVSGGVPVITVIWRVSASNAEGATSG